MQFTFTTERQDGFTIGSEIGSVGRICKYTVSVSDEKLGSATAYVQMRPKKEDSTCSVTVNLINSIDSKDIPRATALITKAKELGEHALVIGDRLRNPKSAYTAIISALENKSMEEAYLLWGLCPSLREEFDGKVLAAHLIQSDVYLEMVKEGMVDVSEDKALGRSAMFAWESFNRLVGGDLLEVSSAKEAMALINEATKQELTDVQSFRATMNELVNKYSQ
ncbi:hypothetical protein [Vibrio crassostreae]|uniref:hypothetical protein n=1 Tax=Vibrio crassostreae TaxID=246167 RepID=UPI001B311781|nr:hypothetical protein [Vibrio crassostreae]